MIPNPVPLLNDVNPINDVNTNPAITQIIVTAASLAPALLVGVGLGMVAFRKINARYFRWFSMALVICAGILGILSGFGVFK